VTEKERAVKPITQKRLQNIALYYLGRYESSAENLRRLLERRILRAERKGAAVPPEARTWIDSIIKEMLRQGYVDDGRFARSLAEKYRKAGKSQNYIRQKLTLAGVASDVQDETLSENTDDEDAELNAALLLVKKRKLGCFRREEDRALFRKKDLAVLARAGFSYQTAVKALGDSERGEDENVWD